MLLVCIALVFIACSNSLQYVKDSSSFSSFELDYHDIESVIDENAKSFIKSNLMKKYDADKKAVMAISNIENLSDEKIDTEFISRKLIRRLSSYEQIVLTNAVAGSGAKADSMIEDSRKLTENDNFNQYTTKEKGRILAPEYSLSGKITKSIKNIGKKQRVDYQFLFIVSDLDSGREVWSNDTIISKAIKKEEISKYSTTNTNNVEATKYNEIGWNNYYNSEYGKAKKYFKKACNLGLKEACENVRKAQDSEKEARIARSFLNDTNSTFGGIVGADVGIFSGGRVNMPQTTYLRRISNQALMKVYIEEFSSHSHVSNYPVTLRVGGFYKKDKGLFLETNFLYRIYDNKLAPLEVDCIWTDGQYCNPATNVKSVDFQHSQIGGNLRIGYGNTWRYVSLIGYIGGGAFLDVDSNMTIRGHFSNRVEGYKDYNLTKKIQGIYPFWEIGSYMTYKDRFFVEMSYRYVFEGDIDKYWVDASSFNLGIGVFLSKKMFSR